MFNELRFVHALIEFGSYARHVASEAQQETRDTRVNLDGSTVRWVTHSGVQWVAGSRVALMKALISFLGSNSLATKE